jgi:uncharacterized protein (TIRG00374 family)
MTSFLKKARSVFNLRGGGILFGIILLLALGALIVRSGESRDLWILLKHASFAWLLLAALLQVGTYFCNALMWHATLRRGTAHVPFLTLLRLSISKLFLDQAAPSAGLSGSLLVMKGLSRRNVPHATAVGALFAGLSGYYVAYTLLFSSAIGIIAFYSVVNRLILGLAMVFGVVVIGFAAILVLFWSGILIENIPGVIKSWKPIQPFIEALHQVPGALIRNWWLLLEVSAAAAGIFVLDTLTVWTILHSLGITFPMAKAFASFMVASVASTVGFIPGGLGVFEGSSTGMLTLLGLPLEAAVATTLILRGFTYWLPMLPGLFIARHELKERS